ncbi:MAG: hypothetical protein Q4Q62_05640 [Thermoplasmata archaeon]|nr:hypothetical protein [Thermoplasmata archaeon]
MKVWEVIWNQRRIVVENGATSVRLIVDGQVVDTDRSVICGILCTRLPDGESVVAVVYSGAVRVNCTLIVDGVKVMDRQT